MMQLPIIHLQEARSGDLQARARIARLLDDACRSYGFFYVTGHGIPPSLREQVFELSRSFFALPEAVKTRWHINQSAITRGYDPVGWQSLDPGKPADMKESFYLGVDRGLQDPLVLARTPNHGPNQWPEEALVPGFKATTTAYARALSGLGHMLLSLLAESLALPANYFDKYLQDPMPVLRLLHYPPRPASLATEQMGCGAHTDWGSLTVLAQDPAGGLQVQLHGQWIDAPYIEDSFVINLGDLMSRWSNDRWCSTLHRVLPQAEGRHRYSAAYFFDIDYHAEVNALPGCFDATHPARYAPITAGDHIMEMYRQTTLSTA